MTRIRGVYLPVPADGVAPDNYHATSIYPEFVQVEPGRWVLLAESRMDCVIRKNPDGTLEVVEFRRLKKGDLVAVGRGENGEDGIYVHAGPLDQLPDFLAGWTPANVSDHMSADAQQPASQADTQPADNSATASAGHLADGATASGALGLPGTSGASASSDTVAAPSASSASPSPTATADKFAFRTGVSRETSFSLDYDTLYQVLRHDRDNGHIVWVAGPAVVFDADARRAFAGLIDAGYVHGLLAGNALATHDLEAALYGTALGQGLYDKRQAPRGHYHHLDAINTIRGCGSIRAAVQSGRVRDGVMHALETRGVPYVLAGSIRDDGPLPEVIADVYAAQDAMRAHVRRATTVVALATALHTIATGNMTPSYQAGPGASLRPVHFFIADISEFAAGKLADRGSLTSRSILTNVQDFVVNVHRALTGACRTE
uniref:Arginine dihydrolase ArgZ/ArgE-like C-terminal second subdomain domain-containing protein n=1 Tax=Nitratidesulfovibrio vulgaris (strain DSM 19637 / Miyazaki F) TaxID=883 RepID=B8DMW4_NITV9